MKHLVLLLSTYLISFSISAQNIDSLIAIYKTDTSFNLPEGTFYFDDDRSESKIITLKGPIITSQNLRKYDTLLTAFLVRKSYDVIGGLHLVLALNLALSEPENDQQLFLLRLEKDALQVHERSLYNDASYESLINSLKEKAGSGREEYLMDKISVRYDQYYHKAKYDELGKLPTITEADIPALKAAFIDRYQINTDEYYGFLEGESVTASNYNRSRNNRLNLSLTNLFIEKGLQPFSSMALYKRYERETEEFISATDDYLWPLKFLLNFIKITFLLFGGAAIFWAVGRFTSIHLPKSIKAILEVMGPIGFATSGLFIGLVSGWNYGESLGYTGGDSMGKLMLAVFCGLVGIVVAMIIVLIIKRKTASKKTQQFTKNK